MNMFKLVYVTYDGESLELYSRPFQLLEVEGLGEVDADFVTHNAIGDGEILGEATLQSRVIDIRLRVRGKNYKEVELNRRKLGNIFNPKKPGGTLYYVSDHSTRKIPCVPLHVPKFPDGTKARNRNYQDASITLKAPMPFWLSVEPIKNELSAFTSLFALPSDYWVDEPHFNFMTGIQGGEIDIYNGGDVASPIRVEITGENVNPRLRNRTTGKYVRVLTEINEGDTLIIDTGTKEILLNGKDVFYLIDWRSEFFELIYGNNEIAFEADKGEDNANLKIYYHNRYNTV